MGIIRLSLRGGTELEPTNTNNASQNTEEDKDPAARNMAAAGGRTDGGGGGGEGEGSGGGGEGGDAAWLRDADVYMSSALLLNTSQQVKLAPYFNRETARR
jgi:hypothetical protein